jgi:hypothetical protein
VAVEWVWVCDRAPYHVACVFVIRVRKRGRVAAAEPRIIPRPGSMEERIASSAVLSIAKRTRQSPQI